MRRRTGERGVGGRREIGVEFPERQGRARRAECDQWIGRARGRQRAAIEIPGQQTAEGAGGIEAELRRRRARQHLRAIEGAGLGVEERGAGIVEDVVGRVIRVGPHADLRIVREAVGVTERVAVIAAGRIARRRDGDALLKRRGGDLELRNDPAVGNPVVGDDRIAVVLDLAAAAESTPQRVEGDRSVQRRAGLGEHGEVGVDGFDDVVRADGAVGVRRRGVHDKRTGGPGEALSDAVEIGRRRRRDECRGRAGRTAGTLHDRIRVVRQHAGGWNAADRLGFQVPEVPRSGRHLPQRRRDVMVGGKNDVGTPALGKS